MLGAYRLVDGKYYTVSTTPVGDKLFVKAYTGDLGTFKAGPGNRDIRDVTVKGSLFSSERSVGIGKTGKESYPEPVAEWQVPVGEYTANDIYVNYGPLRIEISTNYHSDGKRQDSDRQRKFMMQIGKDKPYVLDFSNKPDVMFASPAKESVYKPGDNGGCQCRADRPGFGYHDPRLDRYQAEGKGSDRPGRSWLGKKGYQLERQIARSGCEHH